ncbi:hypothetical protein, partial [Rugamonas sp.]|uniref:hypothetical protein n=1 Tax=Rugamonas sp. TaxID=1926287 RepID=UPI0025F6153F
LSAARKKEYEAFEAFRQPLLFTTEPFLVRPVRRIYIPFCGEANYSKAAPGLTRIFEINCCDIVEESDTCASFIIPLTHAYTYYYIDGQRRIGSPARSRY